MTIKFSDITGGGIPYGNNAGRPANPGIGKLYSNGEAQRLELYTASGWNNIVQEVPGVAGVTGQYLNDNASNTIQIVGTNFVSGALAYAIGSNGVEVAADSTSFNSIVQLTAVFSNLSPAYEPYNIKVVNPSNLFGILPNALYINQSPIWQTQAGSLGTFEEQVSVSISATTTEPDSTAVTYTLTSGALPSGVTLNSSTGLISGTLPNIVSDTTYTFTINASDGYNNIPRTFSITSTANLAPVWTSASGLIGIVFDSLRSSTTLTLAATDNENNNLTYSLVSGSIPTGMTFNSNGTITGTAAAVSTNTTFNFVASVADRINTVTRSFSIDVYAPVITSITSSTTWTAPLSLTSVKLLMVGGGGGGGNSRGNGPGGGGGGAGIIYDSSADVVPGTEYTLVVGSGGGAAAANNQSGGPGCITTGFGASVGGGGGGVSEYNNNCNQPATCTYQPSTTISGPTANAEIRYDAGSGGCSFGAQGSGTAYSTTISGSSVSYGGINGGPNTYGSGGVISSSNGGNGIIIISY